MSHVLRQGVADQIAYFRAFNTDGSALTTLTSATAGLSLSVFRVGASSVSIASRSNKAADDTAHADGAIRNVGGNLYTIDLPDAACATQVPSIVVRGSYTGGVIEGVEHPIVAYNPALAAVGANTTTPLDAAGTRSALGMSTADLPTEVSDKIALSLRDGESVWPEAVGEIAAVVEAGLLNEADGRQLLAAISTRVQQLFDAGTDVPVATLVSLIRDELLGTTDWRQLRHRLGIDGTKATPASSNPNLGRVVMSRLDVINTDPGEPAIYVEAYATETMQYLNAEENFLSTFSPEVGLILHDGALLPVRTQQIVANAIGSDQLAASAITEIQSGLATSGNVTDAVEAINEHTTDVVSAINAGGLTNEQNTQLFAIRTKAEDEAADAVIVSSLTIAPGVIQSATRNTSGLEIDMYVGEDATITRFVYDSAGEPVDLSGMTLQFVIETAGKAFVAKVDDADISVTGTNDNGFTLTIPSAALTQARTLKCALWDMQGGKRVWGEGDLRVTYVPQVRS